VATLFPNDAPTRECLVLFGDTEMAGGYATYHLWFTDQTRTTWENREQGSNDPLDATFVYGNERAIYNVGTYYHGSPWHWTGYDSPMAAVAPITSRCPRMMRSWRHRFGADAPANFGSDPAAQREQVYYWMEQQLGLITSNRRFCHMYVNGMRRSYISRTPKSRPVICHVRPMIPRETFTRSRSGLNFRIRERPYTDFRMKDATLEKFTTTGGAVKVARYRWSWMKRAAKGSALDYSEFTDMVDALQCPRHQFHGPIQGRLGSLGRWSRSGCASLPAVTSGAMG